MGTEARRRILVVDDHPIVREGLRVLLEQPDLTVCGEAASVDEALERMRELKPDALIIDISLGRESGLELIRRIRETDTHTVLFVLSMHDEMIYAERALRMGANGFLMKQEGTDQLVDAVRRVLLRKMFVSAAVADRLLTSMATPGARASRSGIDRLTDRELEVFRLIGMGIGSVEIARQLSIGQKTVETYRSRIKEKLGLETSAELVIHASSWVRDRQG
jgi:DNA-binding NarL/FixJ family response regulator